MEDLGAGVSINPIAFLIVQSENVKLLPVTHLSSIDKLLDYVPELIEKANTMMNKCIQNKKEETHEIVKEIQKNVKKEEEKKENKIKEKKEKAEKQVKRNKPLKQDEFDYEESSLNDEDETDFTQYDD